jgi:hypothetical protein
MIEVTEYPIADFFINGNILTTTKEILDSYEDVELFSSLEERIICYLLSQADENGVVPGRSSQVIEDLLYLEYADADDFGKDLLEKQVKSILHGLYKKQFISRRKNQEVFISSSITVYKHFGCCDGLVHITITSLYINGQYEYMECNVLGESDKFAGNSSVGVKDFIKTITLGRVASIVVKLSGFTTLYANLLNANSIDMLTLKKAGWIKYDGTMAARNGKLELLSNTVDNVMRLVYTPQ